MADDVNRIKKWIKKWQKDKGDMGTGEENPHITGPEEKLPEAADKGDMGTGEENPHITGPEEKLPEAEKNFRDEAAKVDEDEKSGDTIPPENIVEYEPAEVKRHKYNPKVVEKGRVGINMLTHKPIITTLVIVVIVLGGFLLYSQMQLSNQSYKIENFNANWNQSLADLRSGNTSIVEYCNNRVHDEDLCNRFMNLQYMN
jgi:cell division protein FtsL